MSKLMKCMCLIVLVGTVFPVASLAVPGDLIATVTVPVPAPEGVGIGVAVNCEDPATIFYTNTRSAFLHSMTAAGAPLGSVPLTDAAGAPISFGAISWDDTRKMIWGGTDNSGNPLSVYLIDPITGVCTYVFTMMAAGCCGFCDGIALDNDETIWVSDDVDDDIEHWTTGGVYIGTITPTDAGGGTLGLISGIAVGKGDLLYLGRNGVGEIVAVTKAGTYISKFATAAGRDEDLECDLVSFAPLEVLWSKDAYGDFMEAFEVEPGTCACAGGFIVHLDIKPTSCPNPLNVKKFGDLPNNAKSKKGGILPVAILGSASLDVHDIDVSSLILEGVAPIRSNYEDVAAPVENGDECECTTAGPDGFMDLTLKFEKREIIATLGAVATGDLVELTLTGVLLDGTPFDASDCVTILAEKLPMFSGEGEDGVVLGPAVPNPFNPITRISYVLPSEGFVTLSVHDVTGKLVTRLVSQTQGAGEYVVEWDAKGQPSGIYFCRIEVGAFVDTRKMILLK